MMRLYKIEPIEDNPKWSPWYDELHGLVVRCESEDRCRQIAHDEGGGEVKRADDYAVPRRDRAVIYSPWLDPEATVVTELTVGVDEEIVLRDYNAG
jgi:hypothetical protein